MTKGTRMWPPKLLGRSPACIVGFRCPCWGGSPQKRTRPASDRFINPTIIGRPPLISAIAEMTWGRVRFRGQSPLTVLFSLSCRQEREWPVDQTFMVVCPRTKTAIPPKGYPMRGHILSPRGERMERGAKGMSPWNPKLPAGFLLRETGKSADTRMNGHTGRGPRPQRMAAHKSINSTHP